MVHYHRIVRCPYCNAWTDYTSTTSSHLYGTPMRTCRRCGKSYFDSAYQEEALAYYSRHMKQIDKTEIYLNGFGRKLDADIKMSLQRLSNPAYLEYLVDHDVEVFDYFYRRIGYIPKETYAEKRARKEEKNQADLNKLLQEQEKRNTAQHYLMMGKNNRTFKMVAEKLNMEPTELWDYCKQAVEHYDELHRQYNLTHDIPAQYPSDYER